MKTNKTTAKSTQLSPNTKSTQAIKTTNHTKAIERIEYLKSCIENLKNTKPSERKTNEFDKGIQNARKKVDSALESLIKAFEIPKNLNDKLEKIDSEINHFWEKTMPQKVPQEQYEILQVPNDEGRLVKKWHKVLEKPQAKSTYTQEYVDRIFRAIDEFYEFVDSHLLDKERFIERINLEVNELKKRIEKIMQQDSIERWRFPYFRYRNIFDIDTQALKKMQTALESLIKAIDIKYDNLVLSKRKDAKGYHYKERICKLIIGGKVSYYNEIVKLDKNKEPIKDIFARVDAGLANVYEAVGGLPKVLCDE